MIFHHVPDQFLCLPDSIQNAVVAAVSSVFTPQVHFSVQLIQHLHGKIELLGARFPTAHIQMQIQILKMAVMLPDHFQFLLQFINRHL